MLTSTQPRVFGKAARPGTSQRRVLTVRASLESEPAGGKVERWLKTPFDVLSFAPRAAVGALVSMPEKMQTLQADVEKVLELVQDPRPIPEKQTVVLKEVEDTLVEFLEKGASVETDVLNNIKTFLPPEAASFLNGVIPGPPSASNKSVIPVDPVPVGQPSVIYQQQDVYSNQVASEMTEIKKAVGGLKAALDAVRTNPDVSKTAMLRVNLKDARDMLARRLNEVTDSTKEDPSIAAATREAHILLDEVDAQFFSS